MVSADAFGSLAGVSLRCFGLILLAIVLETMSTYVQGAMHEELAGEQSVDIRLASSDDGALDMVRMDMASMMRPDGVPPLGVMGGMNPPKGKVMGAVQYMRMRMDDHRSDTDRLSTAEVLSQFPVTPLAMDMEMVMAQIMYGITDQFSIMGMVPFVRKDMPHVTRTGVRFTTRSDGIGDVKAILGYKALQTERHRFFFTGGVSLPAGSIDETDDTPAGPNQVLPYPMQNGSGTFDLMPGFIYAGRQRDYSWGAHVGAMFRLGENDRDYTLGDIYQGSIWGARKWNGAFSSSLRVQLESEQNIDGADPRLNPRQVPTADPDLRAGDRVNLGLGVNYLVRSGPLKGLGVSAEAVIPVFQDLDGPQLERDYAIAVHIRKRL